ncbi:alpha/beta fold hydrolase [Nocardia thailandica]
MQSVTSADGTTIAYDRSGTGTAGTVVLIGGAFADRRDPVLTGVAERLATDTDLAVLLYDRRGRGDSADSPGVYAVANEIADLRALLEDATAPVTLFGWSSGAILALLAARELPAVSGVVALDPPFVVDPKDHVPPKDLHVKLHKFIADGKAGKAGRYYLGKAMGVPILVTSAMRITPYWKQVIATAPATAHDWEVVRPFVTGRRIEPADWDGVPVPVLVLVGEGTAPTLTKGGKAIAAALPQGEFRELPGVSHNPTAAMLAPIIGEFATRAS